MLLEPCAWLNRHSRSLLIENRRPKSLVEESGGWRMKRGATWEGQFGLVSFIGTLVLG